MTRFADSPTIEAATSINAPVADVWTLITDINLPGRFQEEFLEANWLDSGPALEARFAGRNERNGRSWETISWVTAYEPLREFGWSVSDRDNPGATWTYYLEENGDATELRFRRVLGPGPSGVTSMIERHPEQEEEIIAARDEEQRANMIAVLEGIRALAEEQRADSDSR